MREETKRAAESLAVAVVLGVLHLAWLSDRFTTDQGPGGVTLLMGCTLTTGVLWAMLALRSLAADGQASIELDDGLTSMAVTAWVIALVPPRAANFLLDGAADDFSEAYLPTSLLVVFVMLAAQALWKTREVRFVFLRLLASTAVGLVILAGCLFFIAGGTEAGAVALRALGAGGIAAIAAAVQWRYRARL